MAKAQASLPSGRPAADDEPLSAWDERSQPDPDQIDIGPRWPAWKVSVFVIVFCGAFWTGLVWLGRALFA